MRRVEASDHGRASARLAHTLNKARQVQQNLLPRPGQVARGVELAAIHRPAEAVAEDFYDVPPLPDGTIVCCVADVIGHGVPAAMVAAVLKVLILDAVEVDADPGQVVRRVNRRFAAVAPSYCFATLLVARWCPARQTLWFASAGHEAGLLLIGSDPPKSLGSSGTMLGGDAGRHLGDGDRPGRCCFGARLPDGRGDRGDGRRRDAVRPEPPGRSDRQRRCGRARSDRGNGR